MGKIAQKAAAGITNGSRKIRDLLPNSHALVRFAARWNRLHGGNQTANPENTGKVKETSWIRLQLTRS
jgi:hypothetical protein